MYVRTTSDKINVGTVSENSGIDFKNTSNNFVLRISKEIQTIIRLEIFILVFKFV